MAAERLRHAAFDGSWETALGALAQATGGHAAQLIGLGGEASVLFNRAANIPREGLEEFVAIGGGDPRRNARVSAGLRAPILELLSESDFGDLDEVLRSQLYADLFYRYDIMFNLQATLARSAGGTVGLAVLYGRRHGLAGPEERTTFAALAPVAQEAVRLQLLMEGHGVRVLRGALDAVGIAAFICTSSGLVRAMTPQAEDLVRDAQHLSLSQGRLRAVRSQDAPAFKQALWRTVRPGPGASSSTEVALRSPDGALLVCHVARLPGREFPFGVEASTLVFARTPRDRSRLTPVLQSAYGLTKAEAGVVLAVGGGQALADIARERAVSLQTIRTQLKFAAAKLGVRRQAEIAARLGNI